ncbi:uncharacterized protein [Dysidea avara]|uniref:uncharacterized protein n=1 Tax=Dysidea avara TaxID=196820 RepID=UPI00332798A7
METGFIPHKINFVFGIDNKVTNLLLIESHKSMSNLMCGCGILKFYNTFKVPMDLVPVFPVFQVEIGQTATLPLVNDCIWGYSEPDLLLLADCTRNNQVIYKASLRRFLSVQLNRTFTDFALVTEFDTSYCNLYSDHLKRLAIACPNLQRLNLRQNEHCLKKLQGLCTIARTCLSLQGLNLKEVSAEDVEDQIELWVILSNMKLTHLAVDVCILLSSIEENKTELAGLFQKCQSLQVLETSVSSCNSCASTFLNNSLSVVSHFQALIYYMYSEAHNQIHYCATALHDIVTSCKQLKCLLFQEKYSSIRRHHLTVSNCSTLEQLSIYSSNFDVPTDFMASISSHGGLVHVKMQVKSVTSEGIAVLVTNSPNLLTFHAFVDDDSHLEQSLKVKMPDRKLFKCGDYKVAERFSGISLQQIYEPCSESADLELFWW